MSFRRIANCVGAEPFRPFRIKMTNGETFEIRHPETIAVGRSTAHAFTWMEDHNQESKDQEREISILLIESIEPLKPTSTPDQSQN